VVRKFLRGLAVAGALGFIYVAYVYLTLPDVRVLATQNPSTTAFIQLRAREAQEAGRAFTVRQRWVPYTHISNNLRRAVLVAEDAAFFDHDGIDLKALRASVEHNWGEGRFERGASTITQQLAKNLYLSPSRNPIRKLKELLITRRLEAALTKRRILEIYLNVIEWGDSIFGAEAAARAYFGKPASALSPQESALLAGAIINPRQHNPARPTARLRRRQQIIEARMGIKDAAPPVIELPKPEPSEPQAGQVSKPISATQPPQSEDNPIPFLPINRSPPIRPVSAQSVQPLSHNSGAQPLSPSKPKGST
jgi:monofunctional biosynthetic peptidoglycan transglycosylase